MNGMITEMTGGTSSMLYIRADANSQIGTGHIMRCMAIANEFRRQGQDAVFIVADDQSAQYLEGQSFQYICLNTVWNDLNSEIELLINYVKQYNIDKILIDTYFVSKDYLNKLNVYTKTIYIDDIADFVYPVHMLINYNIYYYTKCYEDRYRGLSTKLLLGCEYAPLRGEFAGISHLFSESVSKVFVTTGGTDNYNVAGNLLGFLNKQDSVLSGLQYHVIVGKYNFNKTQLEQLSDHYENIVLHYDVTNMSEIMLNCDIAITAGGSTMYELCACAVPMITYSIADNQIDGVLGFDRQGVAKYCGDIREREQEVYCNIYRAIIEYQGDNQYRRQTAERMKRIVDGQGAYRLFIEMNKL